MTAGGSTVTCGGYLPPELASGQHVQHLSMELRPRERTLAGGRWSRVRRSGPGRWAPNSGRARWKSPNLDREPNRIPLSNRPDQRRSQRLDPAVDGRPDPRLSVRENAPQLGRHRRFDFYQTPSAQDAARAPPTRTASRP